MSRIGGKVANMISRGIVLAREVTARGFHKLAVQLAVDEPEVQHFTIHGFASAPQVNADMLAFSVGGNADHIVALVGGRGPDLEDGESAAWNDHGWMVKLLADRVVVGKWSSDPLALLGENMLEITDTTVKIGGTSAPLAVARSGDIVSGTISGTSPSGPVTGVFSGTITTSTLKVFAE